ncbi:Heat shock protein GrpE [Prochlorococcus sp. MIT 0703]|nr:Heat shock protein GrpE [Prochlorococcus sp. MIT 0703]
MQTVSMSGDAPTPAHDPAAEDLEASVPLESVASMNSDEGQSSGQSAPLADNEARLQQLEQEHSSLREEHETLRSQYMRIAADFDNFRKRQSRDQDDLRLQLICTTLSEILPVVDNFERARQQLEPQGEEAQALHRSYQGLYKQLVEVLKQLGVASMRVVGQAFDPTLHEAVSREPSEEHPEDVVTEELQRGYHLNGRVLRHALVKVSMGPGPQSGASASSAQLNADSTATFQGEADPAQPGV